MLPVGLHLAADRGVMTSCVLGVAEVGEGREREQSGGSGWHGVRVVEWSGASSCRSVDEGRSDGMSVQ